MKSNPFTPFLATLSFGLLAATSANARDQERSFAHAVTDSIRHEVGHVIRGHQSDHRTNYQYRNQHGHVIDRHYGHRPAPIHHARRGGYNHNNGHRGYTRGGGYSTGGHGGNSHGNSHSRNGH
ncbi:hypothetical protein [Haloferula sp.]|uniref:hypothetical protein n=1 Tax=Haloferula sp. TaxID=2497595 RepID=UPI003C755057